MPVKSIAVHCRRCDADTPHLIETPNHVLHGVLTLFTIGFWVIPWIIVAAIGDSKPVCSRCPRGPSAAEVAASRKVSKRANVITFVGFVVVAIGAVVYAFLAD
jgi:hypothetical protein